MTRLLRIEDDYFCFGVDILDDNTIKFPPMEREATLTYKVFLDGLQLDHVLKVCERMKWKTTIISEA